MTVTSVLVTLLVAIASAAASSDPRAIGSAVERIHAGRDAKPHEFPWMVSLQWNYLNGKVPLHHCGGAIINELWIVTAAHCVVGQNEVVARLEISAGKQDVNMIEDTQQQMQLKRIIKHEKFPNAPIIAPFDIALILLERPLTFNTAVQPIRLPVAGAIPTGNATISGWGDRAFDYWADPLQTVDMPLIDRDECSKHSSIEIHEGTQCTGPLSGGPAVCNGDSGSPLVQYDNGIATYIGIASWGSYPCGGINHPSVFTRVSYFNEWIRNNMN